VTRAGAGPGDPEPAPGDAVVKDAAILARGVARLPGPRRQILILATLEGLRTDQIAQVMGMGEREVIAELVAGRRELREQPPSRVLIIEDEPVLALDLQQTVESAGHRVTGIATTHRAAVELAQAEPPGILLADIHLADASSGIEAVAAIQAQCPAPAIFITGFPDLLLARERPEAACVLTKPFDPEMLSVALAQSLRRHPG
jgi:CheY-like chemotaxis protein